MSTENLRSIAFLSTGPIYLDKHSTKSGVVESDDRRAFLYPNIVLHHGQVLGLDDVSPPLSTHESVVVKAHRDPGALVRFLSAKAVDPRKIVYVAERSLLDELWFALESVGLKSAAIIRTDEHDAWKTISLCVEEFVTRGRALSVA